MTNKKLLKKIKNDLIRRRDENVDLTMKLEERGFDSNGTRKDSELYYTTLGQLTEDIKIISYLEGLCKDLGIEV
jgi:hypothetical protein